MTEATPTHAQLREHAGALRLHGLLAHWAEVMGDPQQARWVAQMLAWEAAERGRRSLERRLSAAHIGRFKPLADFDWSWPRSIDRGAVEELMTLEFLKDASNVVLVGPNGVGKTMCACNLGYQAVLAGHTRNSITQLPILERELAKARQYGIARDNEELELGVRCIAAGVYDDQGKLVAGLSISAPADRLDEGWLPKLQATAQEISLALGYTPGRTAST